MVDNVERGKKNVSWESNCGRGEYFNVEEMPRHRLVYIISKELRRHLQEFQVESLSIVKLIDQ